MAAKREAGVRLILPGVPPSLNKFAGRENSWAYRKEKKQWTETVMWIANQQRRTETPPDFAEVEIVYYFPTRGRHDPDNYAGKFLLDGLTKARLIKDDDFKHIALTVRGGYAGKHKPRTEIFVTECERRERYETF